MLNLSASLKIILLAALACLCSLTAFAGPETNAVFKARAENAFHHTQSLYLADPKNSTTAWQFGGACFDLCEFATNDDQKADLARLGIAATQQLVDRDPKSAPGHYYLAMNDGALADAWAPSMASYRLVRDIEREFKLSVALDENFDFAGSDRCLGLLYRDAPGWPISIGNKRKAREFLERAATVAPAYPENQLSLAESFLQWRQRDEAEKALNQLDLGWSAAQVTLTGEIWEKPWRDWKVRRIGARAEFKRLFQHAPGS